MKFVGEREKANDGVNLFAMAHSSTHISLFAPNFSHTPSYLSDVEPNSQIHVVSKHRKSIWFRTVDGILVGTPLIGSQGKLIYVNHNVDIVKKGRNVEVDSDQSPFTRGFFSVFRV